MSRSRSFRRARRCRLLFLDAVVNALAVVIAILIIVRELRERSGDKSRAVEEAPV